MAQGVRAASSQTVALATLEMPWQTGPCASGGVLVSFSVNLTQVRVVWEEGPSIDRLPL